MSKLPGLPASPHMKFLVNEDHDDGVARILGAVEKWSKQARQKFEAADQTTRSPNKPEAG